MRCWAGDAQEPELGHARGIFSRRPALPARLPHESRVCLQQLLLVRGAGAASSGFLALQA